MVSQLSEAALHWLSTQFVKFFQEPLAGTNLLLGDGSSRVFFRARSLSHSAIIILDPAWTQTKDYWKHQTFLHQISIPVPRFYAQATQLGLLMMEDLGDRLLQTALQEEPKRKLEFLEESLSILASLHGKSFPVPPSIPAASRSFDSAKFMEELCFTEEHLVRGLLKLPAWEPDAICKIGDYTRVLENIVPLVFSHRDFHTRNIMYFQERLVLIDFQDARLGSVHYDLASFLYDPYVGLNTAERTHLKSIYVKKLQAFAVSKQINWESFDENLEGVAFQRLIKAAGSFASFFTRFGKTTHLSYIKPALETSRTLSCAAKLEKSFPIGKWLACLEKVRIT